MRLDPPVREHDVRQLGRDGRGRPLGAKKSDVTGATVDRAVDRHHRSTWILIRAGVHADHSSGVLVAALGRIRPRARQVVLIQANQVGCLVMVSAESDIDHGDRAAAAQRRLQQVARFPLAEGDRLSCLNRGPGHGAGVGCNTGGEVDGDGRDALSLHGLHESGNRVGQSWTAADAEDSVDDQVVRHRIGDMMIIKVDQLGHLRRARRPVRPGVGRPGSGLL